MGMGDEGVSSIKGSGDGESNIRGGETDVERRVSIVAMFERPARINCKQNCSAGGCKRDARSFWWGGRVVGFGGLTKQNYKRTIYGKRIETQVLAPR